MSGGFTPMETCWWPSMAEHLTATKKEWTQEFMWMDLRWWSDPGRGRWMDETGRYWGATKIPGRAFFAKRWNTSDWYVRKAMEQRCQWVDDQHEEIRCSCPECSENHHTRPNKEADNREENSWGVEESFESAPTRGCLSSPTQTPSLGDDDDGSVSQDPGSPSPVGSGSTPPQKQKTTGRNGAGKDKRLNQIVQRVHDSGKAWSSWWALATSRRSALPGGRTRRTPERSARGRAIA